MSERHVVPDRDTPDAPRIEDTDPLIQEVLALPKARQQLIWERHLLGVQPIKIADEVGVSKTAAAMWIRKSYQEIADDSTGEGARTGHMVKRRRTQALARLTLITRKAYSALSRVLPPDPEGVIDEKTMYGDGKSLTQHAASSISRLLETLIRVEEVRARIEGTAVDGRLKPGDPEEQDPTSGTPPPSEYVEQRLIIVRRTRLPDAERLPALALGDDPGAERPAG